MLHNSTLIISIKINNIIAFLGGCIGAFTHFLSAGTALSLVNWTELIDYSLRSLIGGVIAVLVKVLGDRIIEKMKSKNKNKDNA